MRALKVYGFGHVYVKGKQLRGIVAANNVQEAADAFGVTKYLYRTYGSVTGNAIELEVALSQPGMVFVTEDRGIRKIEDYKPLREVRLNERL